MKRKTCARKGKAVLITLFTLAFATGALFAQNLNPTMNKNKKIVKKAFANWASGTGSFFDLLADDAVWTVTGSSPIARTYHGRDQFLREAIHPINRRLSRPIVPKVRKIYVDGKTVIALWDGLAIASDGVPYVNTYAWFMKFRRNRIVEVVAFFDSGELSELWKRVPATEEHEAESRGR